jgi:phosphoribosyl 1,2-cyclic phosphodiesterase
MELYFLGCGGGRVVLDKQLLPTGGFRIHDAPAVTMHVDPGPGALLRTINNKLSPQDLNAVFVSHCHLDHAGDAKIMVEAMTLGHWKEPYGALLASKSVLLGDEDHEKEMPEYFKSLVRDCRVMSAGDSYRFGRTKAKLAATKTLHEDPGCVGFIYASSTGSTAGYTSDTQDFGGLWKQFDCSLGILIVNCILPRSLHFDYHLCVDEVIAGVSSMKKPPKLLAFTHFGLEFIKAGIGRELARFEKKTGVKAVAAKEGLRIKC